MTKQHNHHNTPRKGTFFPGPVFHSHATATRWHYGKGGVRIIEFPKHLQPEDLVSTPIVNEKARCIPGMFSIRDRLRAETARLLDAFKTTCPKFHAGHAA